MEFIKGAANIQKAINGIRKSANTIGEKIHVTLVSSVQHALEHNDTTLVTDLFDALPNSINKKNGVSLWIAKYTNLTYRKGQDGKMKYLKPKKENIVFLSEGMSIPFYEMPAVAKANAPFTFDKFISGLISLEKRLIENMDKLEFTAEQKALVDSFSKIVPHKA